jgi:energy-coupling factor transporter ATP-binding protein EcfA2
VTEEQHDRDEQDETATNVENPIQNISDFARLYRKKIEEDFDTYELVEPIGREIVRHLKQAAFLENDFFYEVVAAFAAIPSVLSDIVPILYISGESGSGKSQIAKIIAGVTGHEPVVGASTAASLKNAIRIGRFRDPVTQTRQVNYHLIIENMNEGLIAEEQTLGVLLNGYDIKTDKLNISDGQGGLITFPVFCPKVITTVHELSHVEVSRRALIIATKVASNFQAKATAELPLPKLKQELRKFWDTPANWEIFVELKHSLKHLRPVKGLTNEKAILVNDLIAAGVATQVWESSERPFQEFVNFFNAQKKSPNKGILGNTVKLALEKGTGVSADKWESLSREINVECPTRFIKEAIDQDIKDGVPIRYPSPEVLQSLLSGFSFFPARSSDGKYVYRYRRREK